MQRVRPSGVLYSSTNWIWHRSLIDVVSQGDTRVIASQDSRGSTVPWTSMSASRTRASNGGTCTDLVNAYNCTCSPGKRRNYIISNILYKLYSIYYYILHDIFLVYSWNIPLFQFQLCSIHKLATITRHHSTWDL